MWEALLKSLMGSLVKTMTSLSTIAGKAMGLRLPDSIKKTGI